MSDEINHEAEMAAINAAKAAGKAKAAAVKPAAAKVTNPAVKAAMAAAPKAEKKPLTKKEQAALAKAQKEADKKKQEKIDAAAKKAADKAAKEETAKLAEAEKAKRIEAEKRLLATNAKEINARYELVQKLEGKADDHRLSMALNLAEAKERCKVVGVKFEDWCKENVKDLAYETARKLVAVGESDEPAKALEDMRNKNKAANQKLREKKASKKAAAAMKDGGEADEGEGNSGKSESRQERKLEAGLEPLQVAFDALNPKDQRQFLRWAAEHVGDAKVTFEDDAE